MSVNKGFDERQRAFENRFAHEQDQVSLNDIREVGVDGAKVRHAERHAPKSIAPDSVNVNRGSGRGIGE